jgi:predicted anti-sigma-YlaC factor YlaD
MLRWAYIAAIMEYLADCAIAGAKRDAIFAAAQKHLARCPDCRLEYAQRIQALEMLSEATESKAAE